MKKPPTHAWTVGANAGEAFAYGMTITANRTNIAVQDISPGERRQRKLGAMRDRPQLRGVRRLQQTVEVLGEIDTVVLPADTEIELRGATGERISYDHRSLI